MSAYFNVNGTKHVSKVLFYNAQHKSIFCFKILKIIFIFLKESIALSLSLSLSLSLLSLLCYKIADVFSSAIL